MKILGRIFNGFIIFFLYAPLFVMMFFSFNSEKSSTVFSGFSLRWYKELLVVEENIVALQNTLILALLSALIATVLGTIAAVGLYRLRIKWIRTVSMGVINIPMLNPDIITGISLMLLFVFIGKSVMRQEALMGFVPVLIAHITFNIPYVVLNVLPKLRQTDVHLMEAAQDLGCHPFIAFFKVVLPSIFPGIFSGFLMSITLSFDDFVITRFLAGPSFKTLPLIIYNSGRRGVPLDIYALSTIVFVVILVMLIIINVLQSRNEKNNA